MRKVSIDGSFVGLRGVAECQRGSARQGRTQDSLETDFHEIQYIGTAPNEEQFHDGIIERNPFAQEEI